ncbi:Uncharacterised protein [Candidatus Gugararchaeum adminiculabundum]|nr:Uncharacterised protein [Candidatus Gugararchaeum adminiculabundum]
MSEKSPILKVFGEYPKTKVIDFLLSSSESDFSLTDIAEKSGVGRTTLYQFFYSLVEQNVVIETRKIGRAKLYKVNLESQLVQSIIELSQKESDKSKSKDMLKDFSYV